MALPPWMQIVYGNRVDPTRGISVNTFRQDTNSTPLSSRGARGRGRGSGRSRNSRTDNERASPEGVVRRLRDLGLSERQITRALKDEHGDEFSPTSPGDWLRGAGGALKRSLDVLDVPRAYVTSGLIEASDAIGAALDKIPGVDYEGPEQTDRLKQSGVSWSDFITNAQNHVGFADVIEADPRTEANPVVAAVGGFAFDVAADPLNYLGVGLADEPAKIARAFADDGVARALAKGGSIDAGRAAAKEAARKVLQRGVTALDADELAAIGRRGGLYARTPGTGVVGRTLRVDKAVEALRGGKPLERTVTLAERGTRLGDVASEAAQIARKPLNATLRATAPLVERGLSGTLPGLRAAVRRTDDADEAVGALWTITKEAEARHVKRAFEGELTGQLEPLLRQAQRDGVDGRQLWLALTGDRAAVRAVGRSTVDAFRQFLDDARDLANDRAGRTFVTGRKDYAPRVLTDEALEAFGLARQANGNVRSIAKGRKYGYEPGMTNVLLGETIHDPASAAGAGRSVEAQIEDILLRKGQTAWYNTDAYAVMPEYLRRLGRQMQDEYVGTELKKVGVGRELYRPKVRKGAGRAATPKQRISEWRHAGVDPLLIDAYKHGMLHHGSVLALDSHLRQLVKIADEAEKGLYKPAKWERVVNAAKAGGIDVTMRPVLESGYKQFGAMTGMPVNIVDNLRDIGKMSEPGALGKVAAIHDRLLKMWRQMALLSPGYHWRNTFGGVYMNWLGDVDEGRYKQIAQLFLHDRKGTLATAKIDPDLKAAFEEAKRLGVFSGGQSVNDITLGEGGRLKGLNPFRRSQAVGGAIENELRGAMFLDEFVKNGGDGTEAFAKVQKYHFDYENLGTAERKVRQAVPFYTWTRRSVPLMLEMVVRNPSKINRYFQLRDSVQRLSEEEPITPQYFEDNWAIRLPWEGPRGQRYLMPDLPLMSLVDVTDTGQLGGQLSPFIKTIYEYNSGRQLWKGIPLTDEATPIPTTIAMVPGLVPALRATGHVYDGPDGKPVMTNRDVYLMQQFLPQLGQARRLFPQEDKYEDRRLTSWLSYLFGIGARTNTKDEQANELWRRYFEEQEDQQRYEDLGFERDEAREKAFGPA